MTALLSQSFGLQAQNSTHSPINSITCYEQYSYNTDNKACYQIHRLILICSHSDLNLIIVTSILPTRLFSLTCKIYNKTLGGYSSHPYQNNAQVCLIATQHHYYLIYTRQAFPSFWLDMKILLYVSLYVCTCVKLKIRCGWKVVNVLCTAFHRNNGNMGWKENEYWLFAGWKCPQFWSDWLPLLWQDSRLFSDNWTCY